jgi:hypothetical protein
MKCVGGCSSPFSKTNLLSSDLLNENCSSTYVFEAANIKDMNGSFYSDSLGYFDVTLF